MLRLDFFFFYFFKKILFILFKFLGVLGLRFCARAFSSCGKWGPLFTAVCGTLIMAASLVAEHKLQTRRLSSCGSRAQLLRGTWDPPRPGLESVSSALQADSQPLHHQGSPKTGFLKEVHRGAKEKVQETAKVWSSKESLTRQNFSKW